MDERLFAIFAEVERTHWWFVARRELISAVVERILPPGGSILDVGCGTGFVLERLRERYDAAGVDQSPIALALCRARGLDQTWLGSPENLTAVAGRRFDLVLFLDVLEHLDHNVSALRHAAGVMAPGGAVLVTVPAFRFLWSRHDELNQHRRRYTRGELEALLRRSGFSVERSSYFNTYLFPLAVATRMAGRLLRSEPAGLGVPPAPINRLLRRVFESEKRRLARAGPARGFPFGVSLLAVGRKQAS